MSAWDAFVAALQAHRAAPSAETEAALLASHARFVQGFAGGDSDELIAEFKAKLRQTAEVA